MKEDETSRGKSMRQDQTASPGEERYQGAEHAGKAGHKGADDIDDDDESTPQHNNAPDRDGESADDDDMADDSDSDSGSDEDTDKDTDKDRSGGEPAIPGHGAESPLMSHGQKAGAFDDEGFDDQDDREESELKEPFMERTGPSGAD